jgi:hypothetical protein
VELDNVGANSADDLRKLFIRGVNDESYGLAGPIYRNHGAKSVGAGKIKVARAFGKENKANVVGAVGECRVERSFVGHAADFDSGGHG